MTLLLDLRGWVIEEMLKTLCISIDLDEREETDVDISPCYSQVIDLSSGIE